MIRLLQLLFLGHVHKWKTIEKSELSVHDGEDVSNIVGRGTRYIQQCERCGVVVKRDLV